MTRTLTDIQKAALAAPISAPGTLQILVDTDVADAQAYADEIAAVFTSAGWTVSSSTLVNPRVSTPGGLSFLAQGDLPSSPHQISVLDGLTSAVIDFSQLDAMLPEGVDVQLFVGRVGV